MRIAKQHSFCDYVAIRLIAAREAANISQQELAVRMHVKQPAISKVEAGIQPVSLDMFRNWTLHTGAKAGELFDNLRNIH